MTVIKFLCPNGHPLSSPPDRSGKSGQCPRCQARFVVPSADAPLPGHAVISAEAVAADSDEREQPGASPAAGKFAFLCPNGHKLHGPLSLQGKPGQCPYCRSRFLIPYVHDETESQFPPDFERADLANGFASAADGEPLANQHDAASADSDVDEVSLCEDPPPPPLPATGHPLAEIIRKLWTETRGAGQLELRTTCGETLIAESFSPELSQHAYGVFGVRDENGDSLVSILRWSDVRQVVVRGLKKLPRAWFRGATPSPPGPDRPQ